MMTGVCGHDRSRCIGLASVCRNRCPTEGAKRGVKESSVAGEGSLRDLSARVLPVRRLDYSDEVRLSDRMPCSFGRDSAFVLIVFAFAAADIGYSERCS